MNSIKLSSRFGIAGALVLLSVSPLFAGSTARQTISIAVDPLAVLAVKQGGTGAAGMDLGDSSYISISDQGVTVNGNRLVWTANIPAKVTVQSATDSDLLQVRASIIQGHARSKGWMPVRAGSVIVDGIDREIGGCSLDYMITRQPDAPTTVVATYTITAQ